MALVLNSFMASFFIVAISAKEFHYGAAFGPPFDVTTDCDDINNISPELFFNWGPDNRDKEDPSLDVCGNEGIKFVPSLWGQDWDDEVLGKLANDRKPWGIILENEPNWWGPQPLDAEHGDGCNMTAAEASRKYRGHTDLINRKWGAGVVKLIGPSPVNKYYPTCDRPQPASGCAWQPQLAWLDEYYAGCGTCFRDTWALNVHDYGCDVAQTQELVADVEAKYPGKDIFFGEVGCNGPSAEEMARFLRDFVEFAYHHPRVVGFLWAALNSVGTPGSELSLEGRVTVVGKAFRDIQREYPPILES